MQAKTFTRLDGTAARALVVDDEESITELIATALRFEGWQVQTAATAQQALDLIRIAPPDVAVFDIMLPDQDGVQLLKRVRAQDLYFPVLFLTALDQVADRVNGLTAGGDDYVTKPFSLEELLARLRGLLRRSQILFNPHTSPEVVVGDLVLHEESYEVTRAGESIHLTTTEFELLRFMMRNSGRVLSRTQILDRVWSYEFTGKASVVELYVSYLRRKIDSGRAPMIHTVRGVGYVLKAAL